MELQCILYSSILPLPGREREPPSFPLNWREYKLSHVKHLPDRWPKISRSWTLSSISIHFSVHKQEKVCQDLHVLEGTIMLFCLLMCVGTPPSQTVLQTNSEFSLSKRLLGTQPEIVHAHQQPHSGPMCRSIHCVTYSVTEALSHHLEGEATSPWAQRQCPVKVRKPGQHSAGDGWCSQMRYGNARCKIRYVQNKGY